MVKNPPANAGDAGSIPGEGRTYGKGSGNPLQYSCLENSMDRGAWWATVHAIAKTWTHLSTAQHRECVFFHPVVQTHLKKLLILYWSIVD